MPLNMYQLNIPKKVMKNKNISLPTKAIYGLMVTDFLYDNIDQWTLKSLADITNQTKQNIWHAMQTLIAEKLVESIDIDRKKYFTCKKYFTIFGKTVYSTSINKQNNKIKNKKINTIYEVNCTSRKSNLDQSIGERLRLHNTKKKRKQPIRRRDPLLEQILESSNAPKHRRGTAIYMKASTMLQQLKKGNLFKNQNIDQKWMEQFKIPKTFLIQVWPVFQLISIFKEIVKAYTVGFDPIDKKHLPSTFPDILINPRSGKSLFLKIAKQGKVLRAKNIAIEKTDPKTKQISDMLSKAVVLCFEERRELKVEEEMALVKTAKQIQVNWQQGRIKAECSLLEFVRDYANWIKDEYEGRLTNALWLGMDTKIGRRFIYARGYGRN